MPNKVLFSYDAEDYFEMLESEEKYKFWKSKVMDRSVAINIGEQVLRLNKMTKVTDPIILTLTHSEKQLG